MKVVLEKWPEEQETPAVQIRLEGDGMGWDCALKNHGEPKIVQGLPDCRR